MAAYQVTCITKDDRFSPYERIRRLGGPGWNWSTDEVISRLRQGDAFWVGISGTAVFLEIQYHDGRPYVRTSPDGKHDNNLLSLPPCR